MDSRTTVCMLKSEKVDDAYRSLFEGAGYGVTFAPVLEFEFINKALLLDEISGAASGPYDALIATSFRSLDAIREVLAELDETEQKRIHEVWKSKILFSVGEATSAASPFDFSAVYCVNSDGENLSNRIIEHYKPLTTEAKPARLLFLCSEIRRDVIPQKLSPTRHPNLSLRELMVYSTKKSQEHVVDIVREAHWLVFFSPSGVDSLTSMLSQSHLSLPNLNKKIASIGNTTADALERVGATVNSIAEFPTPESLLECIQRCPSP